MAGAFTIATRLEFVTLDELEAGFADRIGGGALFLSRGLLGAADELYVGASVHVEIETARGERALTVDGVVAWAYPAHPRTPPGREAGAGIVIDRHGDDESRRRLERMLRRPGAGGRVRPPGTRLKLPAMALRAPTPAPRTQVARPVTIPPSPPVTTDPGATDPAAIVPARPEPPDVEPVSEIRAAPPLPATLLEPGGLPPAPQPRVMAMRMFNIETTPLPAPAPPPPQEAEPLPSALEAPALSDLPPELPPDLASDLRSELTSELTSDLRSDLRSELASELASAADAGPEDAGPEEAAPSRVSTELPELADGRPDGLPGEPEDELPAAHPGALSGAMPFAGLLGLAPPAAAVPVVRPAVVDPPPPVAGPGADDTRAGDGPLDAPTMDGGPQLSSLDGLPDAGAMPGPHAPGAFEQRSTDVDLLQSLDDADFFPAELEEQRARLARALPPPPEPVDNPALSEETVTSWSQLDDLPSADADVELIGDDDPAPPVLSRPEGVDEDTAVHDTTDGASLPSLDPLDLRTAEHAVVALNDPSTGVGVVDHTTAESDGVEGFTSRSSPPEEAPAPRALPSLEPYAPAGEPAAGNIGTAFLFSFKRGDDPINAVEAFAWPKQGTKRWSAIDVAREDGNEAALDAAIASSPWLARDASAGSFGSSHTDPGVRVQDVVTKAVALAAEEDDGAVFSDTPVRPAMQAPPLEDDTSGETTVDETFAGREDPPRVIDDEAETDRDMKRPPSKASPEARARLSVLQRFLGGNGRRS